MFAMPRKEDKVTAYLLGEEFMAGRDGKPIFSWTYRVYLTPGHRLGSFYFSEGDARNGQGTFLSAAQILSLTWRGHLEAAGALWLEPLLRRMASGEEVLASEVLQAYAQVHGKEPEAELQPF